MRCHPAEPAMTWGITPMIGQTISHFKILGNLGEGGMGMVYTAEDTTLKRTVALKFLAPALTSDPEAKKCFILEAQTASALDHPNICTIHEINETADGQVFIAMAYYQGETLKERIKCGPTSLHEAIYLIRQVAEGLAKAHEKGIVHRDIKPANLMVVEDELLKILDFGVAEFQHKSPYSAPGVIIGTPAYMSPEQASGKPVDQRSDIWSIGVVFYELLTANLPFAGDSDASLMNAIVNEPPLPLNIFLGNSSVKIQNIIDKMLAKDPEKRYHSLHEFLDDLKLLEQDGLAKADTQVAAAAVPAVSSIAILPFADLSAEKDQEYFCDGLAEEIMNDLARLKGLRVASRNSTFQFKGQSLDISRIGRELKLQNVLEGSIRKGGNRIRIAVRLINAADGFTLWADEYERELADIFQIQDDIAKAVVKNLEIQLAGAAEKKPLKHYTDNVEAYSSYLRGRFYWNKRNAEALKTAIGYFEAAIKIDPAYALAYSGLADTYIVLGLYARHAPGEIMPKALQAAEQALQLDELLPEAHISLGCTRAVYEWKWREAEDHFKRGIELKPDYAEAHHWYAINLLTPLGRFDEAVQQARKALELEPASLVINAAVGLVHYFARHFDAAIDHFQRALDRDPDFPVTNLFLGQAYVQKSRFKEALDCFQRALALDSDNTNMQATYAHAAARADEKKAAREILQKLLDLAIKKYVSSYDIASIHCGLGETGQALSFLEKAAEEHAYLLSYLNVDPILDPLRNQERFRELIGKILGRK
jgi:serine/threonine protein kinase/predicted Zn-dependent protease